ncbi:hypothetical protein Tco_0096652 [Tanacetum coccineum]
MTAFYKHFGVENLIGLLSTQQSKFNDTTSSSTLTATPATHYVAVADVAVNKFKEFISLLDRNPTGHSGPKGPAPIKQNKITLFSPAPVPVLAPEKEKEKVYSPAPIQQRMPPVSLVKSGSFDRKDFPVTTINFAASKGNSFISSLTGDSESLQPSMSSSGFQITNLSQVSMSGGQSNMSNSSCKRKWEDSRQVNDATLSDVWDEAVEKVVEFMDSYFISQENLDSMMAMSKFQNLYTTHCSTIKHDKRQPTPTPAITLSDKLMAMNHLTTFVSEKLDVDAMNYSSWVYYFSHLCHGYGILDHLVDPVASSSTTTLTDPPPKDVEWTKIDFIIRSWIFSTLAPLLRKRLVDLNPTTAKDAWTYIEAIFQDNKRSRAMALKAKLCNLKLGDLSIDGNDDVVTFTLEGLPSRDQINIDYCDGGLHVSIPRSIPSHRSSEVYIHRLFTVVFLRRPVVAFGSYCRFDVGLHEAMMSLGVGKLKDEVICTWHATYGMPPWHTFLRCRYYLTYTLAFISSSPTQVESTLQRIQDLPRLKFNAEWCFFYLMNKSLLYALSMPPLLRCANIACDYGCSACRLVKAHRPTRVGKLKDEVICTLARQLTEVAAMAYVLRFATLLSLYVGVLSLPAQRRSSRLWQWDQIAIEEDDEIDGCRGNEWLCWNLELALLLVFQYLVPLIKWKDGGERESIASATSTGGAVDRREEDICRCTFGLGAAIFISDPLLKLSLSILMHPFAEKTSAVVTNRKGHNEVSKVGKMLEIHKALASEL